MKTKQIKMRSGEAQAAQHRKAGPMAHRLQPRGNVRSRERAEALSEYQMESAVESYGEDCGYDDLY